MISFKRKGILPSTINKFDISKSKKATLPSHGNCKYG